MAETALTHIGPFEVRSRIGRGGMASVYAAFDPRLGRDVAIKVLSPAMMSDAVLRERFVREARVNVRLEHPAILPVYTLGESEDSVYIVMAMATGGSLDTLLREGPLPPERVSAIVTAVAAGLDHAHRRGVVHRDLKPGNVLFDQDGNALIADFGIARLQGDVSTRITAGATIGTPLYLSPEQAQGNEVTGRTDTYALAIMTYEMLTGAPPFTGDTPIQVMYRHLTDPLPDGGLPKSVHAVLERGAAKKAADRYESATAFANALSAALDATPMPAPAPRAPGAVSSPVPPAIDASVVGSAPPPPAPKPVAEAPARGATWSAWLRAVPAWFVRMVRARPWLPDRPALLGALGTAIAVTAVLILVPGVGFGVSLLLGVVAGAAAGMVIWGLRTPVAAPEPGTVDTAAPSTTMQPPDAPEMAGRPSHVLEPGERFAGYRIIERLDDGNRTRVYHAFDEQRQRDVAVRVIPLEDDAHDRVERLRREAALLGRLHHAHIVPFFDFGVYAGASYIVMPLLGGHSLATRIRQEGRLALPFTVELTRQVSGALHYLHGVGIVSRDLKPTGLVFDRHDNLYLADLRIAKDLGQKEDLRLTMAGQPLGTPTYMSPEQFLGDRITPAADQYLLACLVFEMLTGTRPFEADSSFTLMLKHVREMPPPVSEQCADVPRAVDQVLERAFEKDPTRRFSDVLRFQEALAAAAELAGSVGVRETGSGHIFISYSKDDGHEFAHTLAAELRRRGLDVWIDERLEPSDQWWRVIVEKIDSCAAFVAVMTPSAHTSKWVEREVLLADRRGKPPFPVLRAGEAFPIYVGTQYVDARNGNPPETFYERLAQVLAPAD